MKSILLKIILFLSISVYSQSIRMTTLLHSACPTGEGPDLRFVELYVEGTLDVSNLALQFQDSFGSFWYGSTSIGSGTITDSYLYVVGSIEAFDREFPGVRNTQNTVLGFIANTVFGGNKIRLVDTTTDPETVIDVYGFDGVNGENESWNYFTSYAKRNNGEGPSTIFEESKWDIKPKDTLLFKGNCWGESTLSSIVNVGDYSTTLSMSEILNKVDNEFTISPNPIKSSQTLSFRTNYRNSNLVKLHDISGRLILKQNTRDNKIDIDGLNNGLYLVSFYEGTKKLTTKKLIIN